MPLALLAAGRRSKYAVIVAVLLVAGLLGSQSGKLESVTSTDPAAGLPDGADSAAALQAIRRFDAGETTPAVIVVRRDAGLSAADRAFVGRLTADLKSRPLPTAQPGTPTEISGDGTTGSSPWACAPPTTSA